MTKISKAPHPPEGRGRRKEKRKKGKRSRLKVNHNTQLILYFHSRCGWGWARLAKGQWKETTEGKRGGGKKEKGKPSNNTTLGAIFVTQWPNLSHGFENRMHLKDMSCELNSWQNLGRGGEEGEKRGSAWSQVAIHLGNHITSLLKFHHSHLSVSITTWHGRERKEKKRRKRKKRSMFLTRLGILSCDGTDRCLGEISIMLDLLNRRGPGETGGERRRKKGPHMQLFRFTAHIFQMHPVPTPHGDIGSP